MYIGSDIALKGDIWNDALDKLYPIFETNYRIYVLAISIGIFADKQIETLEATFPTDQYRSIPRSILHNNVGILDLLFKSAIITTTNVNLEEDVRMELAFNDDSKKDSAKEFNKLAFLTKFANYGITQLASKIGADNLENVENMNRYVTECASGLSLADLELGDLDVTDGESE
jgi:hypothetical protein